MPRGGQSQAGAVPTQVPTLQAKDGGPERPGEARGHTEAGPALRTPGARVVVTLGVRLLQPQELGYQERPSQTGHPDQAMSAPGMCPDHPAAWVQAAGAQNGPPAARVPKPALLEWPQRCRARGRSQTRTPFPCVQPRKGTISLTTNRSSKGRDPGLGTEGTHPHRAQSEARGPPCYWLLSCSHTPLPGQRPHHQRP